MFEQTKPEKLLLGVHVLVSVGVTLSMAGYFPEGEKLVKNLTQQTLWAISLAVYTILLYLIKSKDDKQKVDETLEYLIYLHFIISLGIFASFHQKEVEKALTPLTKEMKYLWGASSAICAYSFYIVYEEKEAMGHEETEGHGGGHGGGH